MNAQYNASSRPARSVIALLACVATFAVLGSIGRLAEHHGNQGQLAGRARQRRTTLSGGSHLIARNESNSGSRSNQQDLQERTQMISTHEPSTRTDILRQAPLAWGRSLTPTFGSRRLTIQRGLLARLPDIEFVVLAPAAGLIRPPLAAPVIDPASHRELLGRASSLRASVNMGPAGAAIDSPDTVSWHVLATRFADRAVVGAIRTRVYDLNGGRPLVASLFEYSGVHIADPSARQLVERGLAEYVAAQSRRCRRFYQVGGFAVARP